MSFTRFIYFNALIGGWAAMVGWLVSELLFIGNTPNPSRLAVLMSAGVVGAAIGAGLTMAAGSANPRLLDMLLRLGLGALGGLLCGVVGGLFGDVLVRDLHLWRAPSWVLLGLAIGVAQGVVQGGYDRSLQKFRNGIIGGVLGGVIGGVLFEIILRVINTGTGMTSRATAFVLLGMCIGLLIGLVQFVLKKAWLTVLDGYRPGRQLILGDTVAVLGTAENATLPFWAKGGQGVEQRHGLISRDGNGYVLEDSASRTGTKVNGQPMRGKVGLKDGDVIQIGINQIRFNEQAKSGAPQADSAPPLLPVPGAPQQAAPQPLPVPPAPANQPKPAPARTAPRQATPMKPSMPARPEQHVQPGRPKPRAQPAPPVQQAQPAKPKQQAQAAKPKLIKPDCPKCGQTTPGKPGQRHCKNCNVMY